MCAARDRPDGRPAFLDHGAEPTHARAVQWRGAGTAATLPQIFEKENRSQADPLVLDWWWRALDSRSSQHGYWCLLVP